MSETTSAKPPALQMKEQLEETVALLRAQGTQIEGLLTAPGLLREVVQVVRTLERRPVDEVMQAQLEDLRTALHQARPTRRARVLWWVVGTLVAGLVFMGGIEVCQQFHLCAPVAKPAVAPGGRR